MFAITDDEEIDTLEIEEIEGIEPLEIEDQDSMINPSGKNI